MKKAKSILGLTVCAALAASALPMNIIADAANADDVLYGTMKIPYAEFYAAELEGVANSNNLDAVSSATNRHSLETGAGQMLEGVWSEAVSDAGVNKAGNEIKSKLYGVVYPVEIKKADLDALGEDNYGFTELTAQPASYKQATVSGGSVKFSKVIDSTPETVEGSAALNTATPWGDYLLNVTGKPSGVIYGIILDTADGDRYALRHEQNIWRGGEFAWSSGIKTVEAHGNYLEYESFVSLMGKTITGVDYITPDGYVSVDVGSVYVPVKFEGGVSVVNTAVSAGKAEIVRTDVPADFKAEYSVAGLDAQFEGDSFTFENASVGSYTLTAKDTSGKYADLTAAFELTTADMPAAYDDENGALTAAEGFTDEQLAAYVANITSVTVDGTEYAASGKRATVIVKADGTLDTEAAPFAEGEEFEVTVKSAGYTTDLTFTYSTKAEEDKPADPTDPVTPVDDDKPTDTDPVTPADDDKPTDTDPVTPVDDDKPADTDTPADDETTEDEDKSAEKSADDETTKGEDKPDDSETSADEDNTTDDETTSESDKFRKGDVNGDGKVDVTDVVRIAAYVKSVKGLDDDELVRADINGDGKIDVSDISKLAAYLKGIKPLD